MIHFRQILRTIAWLAVFCALAPAARADLQDDLQHGYSLIDQWRVEEAGAHVESMMQTYPRSGDVYFLKARVEFYQGHYEDALKLLDEVEESESVVQEFKDLLTRTRSATAGFVTRETRHFRIRYVEGPDEILFHYAEEVLERSYEVLGKILGHYPREKVLIEIYPDRQPFAQISPLTMKDILTSGTVALCKYRRIMLISPASVVRGYNWMDTLSHEYIHYLLSSASHNNVPLWLHEGIAKFLEARWRNSGHMTPVMETVLAAGLKNDYLVKLEDMMPSLAKLKNAEDVQLAYAEVATMVDYMMHLKGEALIPALVTSLKEGQTFEQALDHHLGMPLPAFQEAWKNHLKSKKLRTIPGLRVLRFEFKNKNAVPGDTGEAEALEGFNALGGRRARDLTLLGDILKERRFVKAAIVEYEKAIQESESLSPILYNKLAGTFLEQKNYPRTEELLHTSLGYYPEFPSTLANLGDLYFLMEDWPQAETYLQQAVRLNPFNPFLHRRLMALYDKQKQEKAKAVQERLYGYLK